MRRVLTFPYRLARRHFSVQLIYTQLLVVILTVIILEFGLVAIFLQLRQFGVDSPNAILTTRASAIAFQLGQGAGASAFAGSTTTPEQLSLIEAELARGVRFSVTNNDNGKPFVSRALVADPAGIVLTSTDSAWAPSGQPVERVTPLIADLTRRVIELTGQPNRYGNQYLYDWDSHASAVAEPIVDQQGALKGVVVVDGPAPAPGPRFTGSWLVIRAASGSMAILAVVAIPALLVSIPVGIWRARTVSRRLSRLAHAADDLARGDLQSQVDVQGEDEIARLGAQFNAVFARLHQADRARKAFIANVSHELRTPLTIIQGTVENLLSDHAQREDGIAHDRQALETMHRETVTLSRLVDDLFTLARLEEATLPLEQRPLQLAPVVEQVVASLHGLAWEERQVVVRSVVPVDLPPVISDETRLRQILGNLLHNAIRHTPEGGMVIVDARLCDGYATLSVSDTGVGIPADQIDRVFDRFFQLEGTAREEDNSGLGLAIVKDLVHAQGGEISVESEPGRGTTFSFTIPLA
jgi:signal transduction histidine kinase